MAHAKDNRGGDKMFDDFLDNEETYSRLESFWEDLFWGIIDNYKLHHDHWQVPYYNTFFSNGKKFMDGNPIFSAKNKINNKSIRVIQEDSDGGDEVISRVDNKDKNELVLICTLKDSNIKEIKEKISSWVID